MHKKASYLLLLLLCMTIQINAQDGIKLHLDAINDASLENGSGLLILGQESGINLAIDRNEILARSNGSPTSLFLNIDGGLVKTGRESITPANLWATGYVKAGSGDNAPFFKVHHESGTLNESTPGVLQIPLNLPPEVTSTSQIINVQVFRKSFSDNYQQLDIFLFNTAAITLSDFLTPNEDHNYSVTVIYTD